MCGKEGDRATIAGLLIRKVHLPGMVTLCLTSLGTEMGWALGPALPASVPAVPLGATLSTELLHCH